MPSHSARRPRQKTKRIETEEATAQYTQWGRGNIIQRIQRKHFDQQQNLWYTYRCVCIHCIEYFFPKTCCYCTFFSKSAFLSDLTFNESYKDIVIVSIKDIYMKHENVYCTCVNIYILFISFIHSYLLILLDWKARVSELTIKRSFMEIFIPNSLLVNMQT